MFFFFKQKTAYEMRISDWSSDVCSSDLFHATRPRATRRSTRAATHPCGRSAHTVSAPRPWSGRGTVARPDHPPACDGGSRGPRSGSVRRPRLPRIARRRSEEHTSELQSLMRISYAVFCLKKKKHTYTRHHHIIRTQNTHSSIQ